MESVAKQKKKLFKTNTYDKKLIARACLHAGRVKLLASRRVTPPDEPSPSSFLHENSTSWDNYYYSFIYRW